MMLELSVQQRRAVHEHAGEPVEVIDPGTHRAYVLVAREQFEQMRSLVESERRPTESVDDGVPSIPAGILQSQKAFWRDLTHLLSQRKLRGRSVCYHGDERIGVGTYEQLIRTCLGRGFPDDAYYLGQIRPQELTPWEPEDIEPLGAHHREDDPTAL
jgi:hypothetical protein